VGPFEFEFELLSLLAIGDVGPFEFEFEFKFELLSLLAIGDVGPFEFEFELSMSELFRRKDTPRKDTPTERYFVEVQKIPLKMQSSKGVKRFAMGISKGGRREGVVADKG